MTEVTFYQRNSAGSYSRLWILAVCNVTQKLPLEMLQAPLPDFVCDCWEY
jgi:hypothetical protein